MRNLLLSTVAFAALAGSAFAADLPSRKEAPVYVPPPAPVFTWTGFYIGADIGGDFGSTSLHNIFTGATTSRSLDTSGVMGGGYVGYNFALGQGGLFGTGLLGGNFLGGGVVLGVEGDFQGTSNSSSFSWVDLNTGDAVTLHRQQNWLASANGRLGVAYDRALFYAIGGGAWAQGNSSLAFTSPTAGFIGTFGRNTDLSGWDVGGGVEYAFTPNWVGRVEYRYYDFGNVNVNPNGLVATFTPIREQITINTVRVGLAYLFSAPAPVPVVAKY
jgi:outer membrane immunogenic protein